MNHSLPIGGVAVVILVIFLHLPMEKQDLKTKLKRVDYAGTYDDGVVWGMHGCILTWQCEKGNFLVLAAATLLLLAMNFGGQTFPWKSAAVIVCTTIIFIMISRLLIGM